MRIGFAPCRTALTCLAVSSLALAIGCSAAGDGGKGTENAATATGAATGAKTAAAAGLHGPVALVADTLAAMPLRPEQRAQVDALVSEAVTRHGAVMSARAELAKALADAVEAGTVDESALKPKMDAVAAAAETARTGDLAALDKLHGILDRDQRVAFAEGVQKRARDAFHDTRHEGREHLQALAEELKLSSDQKEHIRSRIKAEWAERFKEGRGGPGRHGPPPGLALLDAFKGDDFTAAKVMPAPGPDGVRRMTGGFVHMTQVVLPELTAEQRTLAAKAIRARAARLPELSHE